jgi:hypothetical protein
VLAVNAGLSEKVRQLAIREYVEPARRRGAAVIIPVGEIQQKLRQDGFPSGHIRQICTSLESKLFSERLGLSLESPAGQPERVTTILRFRFADKTSFRSSEDEIEDPLLGLVGVLRGAIREGAKTFLHELRKDRDFESTK